MGSAVLASVAAPIAGNLATSIGSKVLGKKAGGLLGSAAQMGASAYGGGAMDSGLAALGKAWGNSQFDPGSGPGGQRDVPFTSDNWTQGIVKPGFRFGDVNPSGYQASEGGGALGGLGEKLGGWFQDADNRSFLYEAGLTALPWIMDQFSEDEEVLGGGGSPPPVATGGPGYGGGSAGGQYGVGWGFDGPNRAGYKPGRV